MKRLLITGATGFLGRHCLAAAQALDGVEIHGTSRQIQSTGGVVWHGVDLRDSAAASGLIDRVRPSHLLHVAWEATPVSYANSLQNHLWLTAGIAMLEAFGRNGGQRFTGVGTSAEYGPTDVPCVEGVTLINPDSIYGQTKAAMAEAAKEVAQKHGFSAAWGRVFLPYGPGDPPQRLLPSVMKSLLAKEGIPLSDGLQKRDFVHAPDVGQQLVRLLLAEASGAFNIGTGVATTVREAVETLAALLGKVDLLEFGAKPRRAGEAIVLVADMARFATLVGIPPYTPLQDGLSAFVRGIRDH